MGRVLWEIPAEEGDVMRKASPMQPSRAWVHRGFDAFAQGRCEAGGSNLYVNAHGSIEMIHRTAVNNDGFVDIILPNSHGYIERGPTWIYTQAAGEGKTWPRRELPARPVVFTSTDDKFLAQEKFNA